MKRKISITLQYDLAIGKVNLNEIVYRLKEVRNPLMLRILEEIPKNYYVSKPISAPKLLKAIQSLIPGKANKNFSPATHDDDPSTTFDTKSLLNAFEHDWSFFKEVVDIFVNDYPGMLNAIREAIKTKDADSLKRNAHTLKGMSKNFQMEEAAKTALNLEEMGDKKKSLMEQRKHVRHWQANWPDLRKYFMDMREER